LKVWDTQKLTSKECNIRKLSCMVFPPLQGWLYIVIIHMFVTIQRQFKFHQREINFLYRSCNSPQGVIINGCWRRRVFHTLWVQMFGNYHQEWQQDMLVIFFHNCCNFISATKLFLWKTPTKIRNSPIKLLVPGMLKKLPY
jgi:hypothetical protein